MRFSVLPGISNSGSRSRIGKICDLSRLPNVEFKTPMLLLRTKGGSVPHLTREVLEKVTDTAEALQIPLSNAFKCYEGMKTYDGNITEFVGLKEHLSFCTLQDPCFKKPSGFNFGNSVSIWTAYGRRAITPESYMDMMETFQPDMYEALSDSDCDAASSTKRIRKSSDHSAQFLDHCLKRHQISEKLQKSIILGVVVGGYNFKSREFCVESLEKHFDSLGGFVINGLHLNGPEVESIELDTVSPIIAHTLKLLPADKLRLVYGPWHPKVVIGLIELGIDLFDSSIVDVVTDRYSAFTFHWKAIPRSKPVMNGILSPVSQNTNKEEIPTVKKVENKLEICLKDKVYCDDFTPLLEGCKCLTCRNHTKAYIHHLFNTRELLGPVLLTMIFKCIHHSVGLLKSMLYFLEDKVGCIRSTPYTVMGLTSGSNAIGLHNLHHYMEFFAFIRDSLQSGHGVSII